MTNPSDIAKALTPAQRRTLTGDPLQVWAEYLRQIQPLANLGLVDPFGHVFLLTDLGRAVAAELKGEE